MTIHDGYGQAETNVVVANGADAGFQPGRWGSAPGPPGGRRRRTRGTSSRQVSRRPGHSRKAAGSSAATGTHPTRRSRRSAGTGTSPSDTSRNEDGFFWFVGRASDVIASRGRTFGPHEVEKAFGGTTRWCRRAVVGIKGFGAGRALRPGVRRPPASRQGLPAARGRAAAARRRRAPGQHVPREVEFVDALPVTPSGKVMRDELRERAVVGRPLWDAAPADAAAATAVPPPEKAVVPAEPVVAPAPAAEIPVQRPPRPRRSRPSSRRAQRDVRPGRGVRGRSRAGRPPGAAAGSRRRAGACPGGGIEPEPEPEPVLEQVVEPAPEPARRLPEPGRPSPRLRRRPGARSGAGGGRPAGAGAGGGAGSRPPPRLRGRPGPPARSHRAEPRTDPNPNRRRPPPTSPSPRSPGWGSNPSRSSRDGIRPRSATSPVARAAHPATRIPGPGGIGRRPRRRLGGGRLDAGPLEPPQRVQPRRRRRAVDGRPDGR